MNATFVQVSADELSQFEAEPDSVESLFQEDAGIPESFVNLAKALHDKVQAAGPEALAETAARLGKTPQELAVALGGDNILKLLEARRAREPARSGASGKRDVLSLDKAWHGVHYLLCGEAEPGPTLLSQAVLGGTDLGDDDEGFSGYGPARYFTVSQVAQIAEQMDAPELESEAAARFDAARMSELGIYPGWSASDADWVMENFRKLRDFYADAAKKQTAIVACLL